LMESSRGKKGNEKSIWEGRKGEGVSGKNGGLIRG